MIYNWIIFASWLVFLAYWFVSAFGIKKTVRPLWQLLVIRAYRILLVVGVLLFINSKYFKYSEAYRSLTFTPLQGMTGSALSVIGIGFAIWARYHLGKNWGMPMTEKKDPELVTSGPYAYVRHPIYTGIMLAMLGSSFVAGGSWSFVLLFAAAYFVYSAVQEDKQMLRHFPDTFPAYKKRTKMLIPFIF